MKLDLLRWAEATGKTSSAEDLVSVVRHMRNVMLNECDWTMMPDSPLDEIAQSEWRIWRQWMRDITNNISVTDNIEFVEIPNPPANYPKNWQYINYDLRS